MKVRIPESISDITLGQFQKYMEESTQDMTVEQDNDLKLKHFAGLTEVDLLTIVKKDYDMIVEMIDKAMELSTEFTPLFKIDGVEYGIVPNFDNMTGYEYRDLTIYGDDTENLHKVMAILFRPVTKKDVFGNYNIEAYKGTGERAEIFRQMPMNIVNQTLVFFWNLTNELNNYILSSLTEEQQREAMQ